MAEKMIIREGSKKDLHSILNLIKELAAYEKAPKEVQVTEKQLQKDGFGRNPLFRTFVADINGKVVGMAFFYIMYSTWKGKAVYLEDIIVTKNYRGMGIGNRLFQEVIRFSKKFGAKRLQFQVLKWNKPAINFYKKYGPQFDGSWFNVKLTEDKLRKMAV